MDISIRRDRRGHGQGRILLDALLDAAKRAGALVLMDFEPQGGQLIEFYLQNDFRICGFNDRYLPGTEDPSVVFLARDL
jgi:ribosomal protein S18 acetylase RimI-like enzyme